MNLLARITRQLSEIGMTESRFGRLVFNDPRFVRDLRDGRTPRKETLARAEAWLADQAPAR